MGAGLPAIAVVQSTIMLNVPPSSQASQLPQFFVVAGREREISPCPWSASYSARHSSPGAE
ncbi:hypothetical protein DBR46_11030 [Pseudomonas sp. KBW05]|nr:hypothetical protein DBR46_11030 [Pseudomonas sp. KBW05]